ncbi:MAG: alpha/beta hydrolase-fold protein [Cytophagales bacterium]|nr:alpha/beta hydrolase-fold protein [Cytophagales bacterium]
MMSRYFFALLFLSVFISGTAQQAPWQTLKIPSKALKIDQSIQVYVPDDYGATEKSYPVLYVIDAHWYFFNGVSIQKTIRGDKILPKMIVVGVDFQHRPYRDSLFNASWEEVVTFVGTELPTYINENYRIKEKESVVFGWEQASFMVSELLFRENPAFDGFIHSNGGYVTEEMLTNFRKAEGQKRYAYIANSEKDIYTIDHSKRMVATLEANELEHLNWRYQLINSEVHETLAYHAMYFGLRHFYHNYASKDYAGISDFHEQGGLPYLEQYFKERGERFELDPNIDDATKNTLIWLSWKRDNFESFQFFMKEFSEVLETRRYASSYWQNRLAQFYLKYEAHQPAIDHFTKGLNDYPDDRFTAAMYAGLGQAYQGINKKKLAKANFRKAIDFAREQSDPNLAEYQSLLDDL